MDIIGKGNLKMATIMSFYIKFLYVRKIYHALFFRTYSLPIKTQMSQRSRLTRTGMKTKLKIQVFKMEIEIHIN